MTDKVQKIREEVERLKRWNNNVRNSTRHMTLQEEDFNRGKHSSYLEILDFIDSLQKEPIIEDLDEAAREDAKVERSDDTEVGYNLDRYSGFISGAEWKTEQMMANAVDGAFIRRNRYTNKNVLNGLDTTCDAIQGFKDKDRIKVLFIKED